MEPLDAWVEAVWAAARSEGLDPAPTDFYLVPRESLWAIAAYGLPHHPGHWRYGRDYWVLRQQQVTGSARLYELVIRGEPVTAYLDAANSLAEQQLVVAHVAGHADLLRHHLLYRSQRSDWPAVLDAAHQRLMAYRDRFGEAVVEQVWNDALSLEDQVAEETPPPAVESAAETSPFGDLWRSASGAPARQPHPRWRLPTADLLGFLAREAPRLEEWQRDCVSMVRGTALYFWPQRVTKLVQEGFATWVQHRLVQVLDWAAPSRVQAAILNAGVEWPSEMVPNPYDLGGQLFLWLERHWGAPRVIALARELTDSELVSRWVTEEMVRDLELYRYRWRNDGGTWAAVRQGAAWTEVRDAWNNQIAEKPPRVAVVDVEAGGQLVLGWDDAAPPDLAAAQRTLAAVRRLWGGPVRLDRPGGPPVTEKEG